MKHAAVLALLLVLANSAHADQLQFKLQVEGGTTYASYARVQLLNAQNQQQFEGDADRYGRINANVPPGTYRAVVVVRGQTKSTNVRTTGASNLKVVTLN